MARPVFYDLTGRRHRWLGRLSTLALAVVILAAALFAATLVDVPAAHPLDIGREREQPLPFVTSLAHLRHRLPRLHGAGGGGRPLRAAFYVPWDPESLAALRRHVADLDSVIVAGATFDAGRGRVQVT